MKYVQSLLLIFFTVLLFSGCYTELATVEHNDQEYAVEADTTVEEGSTTINNHYYLDDDYRRSRLRTSFHYYYPENSSWIGVYYNSYFNDPYWGMRQWSWNYDPWVGYYPAYYPTWGCPPYDPWYQHYPHTSQYPGYYPSQIYVNNTPAIIGKKHRADSPSHEGTAAEDRSRAIPTTPSPGTSVTPLPKTRESEPADNVTPAHSPKRTREEVPWWERKNNDQPKEGRSTERPRTTRNPNVSERKARGNDEAISTDRPREVRRPSASPAAKPSTPNRESKPADRPRESKRQSYTAPSQQSSPPSSSAPSRGSGSSSSSSSSGSRKRN